MYDQKAEANEFVGDDRAEAVSKACRFYGIEEAELKIVQPEGGEIFGSGARTVLVAIPKNAKPITPDSGDRGDRGGRGRDSGRGPRGRGDRDRGDRGDRGTRSLRVRARKEAPTEMRPPISSSPLTPRSAMAPDPSTGSLA